MLNTLAKSWLELQCRMIPSVQRGLVVVGATRAEALLTPTASWPEEAAVSPGLTDAARLAPERTCPVVRGEGEAGVGDPGSMYGIAIPARLVREVPAAHYLLPNRVLATHGGGHTPVEPGDRRGLKVTRKVFQVDLALADATPLLDAGQRVHVRFAHGSEPLAWQWGRRLEQMFLRGFGV